MSKSVRDLLVRGKAAAKAGAKDEARRYLERALMIDATRDQRIEAWLWLSEVSDSPAQKRNYLEMILSHNPSHPLARRGLAILDGRLRREEIVDPNHVSASAPSASDAPQPAAAKHFVCQQCGGRMAFTPDGKSLTCAYCDRETTLYRALQEGSLVEERDFTVALATAKGHLRPIATQALACQGCGVSFVLTPGMLTSRCPYCGSVYVAEQVETQELIPPEGVIPFAMNREQAHRAVRRWLAEEKLDGRALVAPPTGVYVPAWTFDVGGELRWRYLEEVNDRWVPRNGTKVVYVDDTVVPASHTLPASLVRAGVMDGFELDGLAPYDPRYLADWPAETYRVPVADASLVARRRVYEDARTRVTYGAFGKVKDVNVSSAGLVVESFRLVLLPLWIGRYRGPDGEEGEERDRPVVVNGQTGHVTGEKPVRGIRKLWAWLIGEG